MPPTRSGSDTPQLSRRRVRYEFIPSADLDALAWLQPELEQLLLDAALPPSPEAGSLPLGIGRAAELAVLAGLECTGAHAIHVADISDRFGYDIGTTDPSGVRRWEVKGCTEQTKGSFRLSRNEFDKCRTFGAEWAVVQVVFAGSVLVAERITAEHVLDVRELSADRLEDLVPPDSEHFVWQTSALISPASGSWTPSRIKIPPTLDLPGLYTLGLEALGLRRIADHARPQNG